MLNAKTNIQHRVSNSRFHPVFKCRLITKEKGVQEELLKILHERQSDELNDDLDDMDDMDEEEEDEEEEEVAPPPKPKKLKKNPKKAEN